jgi:two-component system, chemotaxis family, sensor kinase CheA
VSQTAFHPPAEANLDTFRQSFREEAGEILVDLESALLTLNENPSDLDLVGRVFRALHTIKGSGAMFGFDELASFTHSLETAFDEVRNGRLSITPALIDLTLAALDQIRSMLGPGSDARGTDKPACAAVLAGVQRLMRPVTSIPATDAKPNTTDGGTSAANEQAWNIRFSPGPEMMRNGSDPLLLLQELGELGQLTVQASMAAIPPLRDLEPERCYISWDLKLVTRAGADAIRDVFIFVEDTCDLVIQPAKSESLCVADQTAEALAEQRSQRGGRREYDKPDSASSLRVPSAKLDQFVDLVGELVTVQARLSELAARCDDPEISEVSEGIEHLTSALRETSMNIRMMPIRGTFERFRRLVHDLARDLGKNVELTLSGADTELDKTVIEKLSDPLMHLIRNSMDHGIEPPEVRTALAKKAMATIHLSARHEGASVLIAVSDDGRGIDSDAVLKRAIERGLTTAGTPVTEAQIFDFIFLPGFSTASQVTDVSGRGVGMDVVRKHVDMLRGSIEVVSKPGVGTTVTLRLPLTLAIIDGLLVTVGDASFVLPLANTLECIELTDADLELANRKHVVNVRGEIVPYIRLRENFDIRSPRPKIEQIMLVETEEGRFGLVVDKVLGNCQTVIKSLGRCYRDVQIVSGATILGNGTVALILDAHRLVQEAIRTRTHGPRARPLRIAQSGGRQRDGTALHDL